MNTTAEKILELLKNNNFEPEPVEGADKCYLFSTGVIGYDDLVLNLLFVENEDSDIISFSSPGLYHYNDDDFVAVINAMNEMSFNNPFVRPVIMGENSIWLYYDHKLFNQEATIDIIHHMISSLVSFGLNLLNKIDEYKKKQDGQFPSIT